MGARRLGLVLSVAVFLASASCSGTTSGSAAGSGGAAGQKAAQEPKRPATLEEIAQYRGTDRQRLLEEGAKTEGKVMLYTSEIVTQGLRPVMDAFQEKYPYIKVDFFRADSGEVAKRAMEEYRAGKHEVDVVDTSPSGLIPLKEQRLLQKFYSPELEKVDKDSMDSEGYYTAVWESYVALGYNTQLVSQAEAPRTYQDLLDPRWKEKMAIAGSSTGVRWVGAIVLSQGEEFLRRLAQQDIRVQNVSGRALADMVIAGEVPLSPTIFNSHVAVSKEKGAPIEWVPIEPVVPTPSSLALAKNAPHPHAALLFMDFQLSQEGQRIYMSRGYSSPRTDMGGTASFKKVYVENIPNFVPQFESWQRLMRTLFLRG